MMLDIYHITTKKKWNSAVEKGLYDFCALKEDGYIHCSTWDQVLKTANSFFKEIEDLLLLKIHTPNIKSEIKYENLMGGEEKFPHIYGPIDLAAVSDSYEFLRSDTGEFLEIIALDH